MYTINLSLSFLEAKVKRLQENQVGLHIICFLMIDNFPGTRHEEQFITKVFVKGL